jgi:hypothetical protein
MMEAIKIVLEETSLSGEGAHKIISIKVTTALNTVLTISNIFVSTEQ